MTTTPAPTTTGIDFVALQADDVEGLARFYEQALDLPRTDEGPPHAVVFATTPIPFAIRPPLEDLDAAGRVGAGVALWLRCDDADALCARLHDAGTPIVAEPADSPFGRTFTFEDPAGYRITVHDAG